MNENSKNLIKLRALSPNNSIHIRVESVSINEHDKGVIGKLVRYRENSNGRGSRKTHIIELSDRTITVYGIENLSKPYEYSVVCGDNNHAVKLWNELFPDDRINFQVDKTTRINLPGLRKLIFNDKSEIVSMPIVMNERNILFVKSINIYWMREYNSIYPVTDLDKVGSLEILDNGCMIFKDYSNETSSFKCDDLIGNVSEAEKLIKINFEDCVHIEDLNIGIKGLNKLNKIL